GTLARAKSARYFGEGGLGAIASEINPVAATGLRYPWVDLNGNKTADPGEIVLSANPLAVTQGNWSAANPANTVSANTVDPNLKNDTTDEVIVGVDRELGRGFAVGANYVWRRYGNFQWEDKNGITTANWLPTTFTPAAGSCPGAGNRTAAADCPTVTFYQPAFQH